MSWSVKSVGRPGAVATDIARLIAAVQCTGPEETIKNKVSDFVARALEGFPPGVSVSVEVGFSQSTPNSAKPTENNFSLSMQINTISAPAVDAKPVGAPTPNAFKTETHDPSRTASGPAIRS